jgi:hypothetical protein
MSARAGLKTGFAMKMSPERVACRDRAQASLPV